MSTRVKREPPQRSGPLRNVSMAFRPASPASPVGSTKQDVVESAVATAYRVFDEYMQRGRQAAYRQKPTDLGGSMRNDRQDPAAMAMRYWTEMAQTFLGMMGPYLSSGMFGGLGMPGMQQKERSWDQGGSSGSGGELRSSVPVGSDRVALAVEISAAQPTEVKVTLYERPGKKQLFAHELRATPDDGKPRLTAIQFEYAGDHLRVRVTIPSEQPVGLYVGPITDQEHRAVGTLEVAIRHRSP